MNRGIASRINRIEGTITALGGCKHCRANRGMCFVFGDEPLPDPCERCGSRPNVTRFVLAEPKDFGNFRKPP